MSNHFNEQAVLNMLQSGSIKELLSEGKKELKRLEKIREEKLEEITRLSEEVHEITEEVKEFSTHLTELEGELKDNPLFEHITDTLIQELGVLGTADLGEKLGKHK